MIIATIISDSINSLGDRLTTLELEYPRYIHPELLTHRVFSRNSQSSRAVSVDRLINKTEEQDWYPIFMEEQKGMAASTLLSEERAYSARSVWVSAKLQAISHAKYLRDLGVHKQVVNRLLEPFTTIRTIVSSTDWSNFFTLRLGSSAQQEIQVLANEIKNAIDKSTPSEGNLVHLPYISPKEVFEIGLLDSILISAARCARISYVPKKDKFSIGDDINLATRLKNEKHLSPFEHVAFPISIENMKLGTGNYSGWVQYRKFIEYGVTYEELFNLL